jgi:hypothetical protein
MRVREHMCRHWAAALVLLACGAGLCASASRNGSGGYPGEAELASRFLTHKDDFTALGNMLDTEGRLRQGPRGVGGPDVLTVRGAERLSRYRPLLSNIGASALSDVPESKDTVALVLPGKTGTSACAYLVHAGPEDSAPSNQKDTEHYWRGPGLYETTRDVPLGDRWFIRCRVDVSVAFPPY